jgi:hemolysin III
MTMEQLLTGEGSPIRGASEEARAQCERQEEYCPPTLRPKLFDGQPLKESIQWYIPPRRPYTRRELIADRGINFVGAAFAWIATLWLAYQSWKQNDPFQKQVFFWLHGAGLITMLNCSAIYHYLAWDWKHAEQLLTLDHIGISAMIMGCYAPVMQYINCYRVFASVCVMGIAVVPLEVVRHWQNSQPKNDEVETKNWSCIAILHIVRYLVMGWAVIVVMPTLLKEAPPLALNSCVVGGLLYTSGVFFFVRQKLEFHLAIWHGAVLVASVIFYLTNLLFLVGPGCKA